MWKCRRIQISTCGLIKHQKKTSTKEYKFAQKYLEKHQKQRREHKEYDPEESRKSILIIAVSVIWFAFIIIIVWLFSYFIIIPAFRLAKSALAH